MKDLGRYLGETYSNSCQPAIMTKIPATLPDTEMPTITPDMGIEHPKTDVDMTYIEKKSIDEDIRQKLRKKDLYKTYMHNIYNLIVGQTTDKLQENAESDATFQTVNTVQDPIGYLLILK